MRVINVDELRQVLLEAYMQQNENWQVYFDELMNHENNENFDEAAQVLIDFIDLNFDMLIEKRDKLKLLIERD